MTLDEALKIVYAELGVWREGRCVGGTPLYEQTGEDKFFDRCEHGLSVGPHEIPPPPLHDGWLAVILRRTGIKVQPYGVDAMTDRPASWMAWLRPRGKIIYAEDPVEAAVLAFADYLRSKEEEHGNTDR
jgi:hypothetical protein